MKRSQGLQRNTPLTRSKPLRNRAPRRLASMTVEDRLFLAWLHEQNCYGLELLVSHEACDGPIQQAHVRDRTGLGLKEPVQESFPLCRWVHEQLDQHRGHFRGWTREARVVWMRAAARFAQEAFRRWMDGRAAA